MKILFVTPRVPYPIDKGDKLRAYFQMKYLAAENDIHLFALDENCSFEIAQNPLNDICETITVIPLSRPNIVCNLAKGLFKEIPFQTSYYFSNDAKQSLLNKINEIKPDVIVCQLIRAAEFVRELKDIPRVMDYVDVISKGLERRSKISNLFYKFILNEERKRALKYEEKVYNDFDATIIISEEDRNYLPVKEKNKVAVIGNGIDLEFYKPLESEKQYDIFFSGNLSYPPNVDAAIHIANDIVPILKKKIPNLKVLIAGATPHKDVLQLANETIDVKGWADDVRDYYKISKVFLAPMRIGTGLQNKILQALAMKIPCVTSKLTCDGIDKNNLSGILVGRTPEEYAELCEKLLVDEKHYQNKAQQGLEFVTRNYDWKNIIDELKKLLETIKK